MDRWDELAKAGFVKTEHREEHGNPNTRWLVTYAFLDGAGQVAMTKVMAEPAAPNDPVRWVASGRTIANNPSTMHLDSLGRAFLVITDNANGEFFKTRSVMDLEGQVRGVIDALGRTCISCAYAVDGQVIQSGADLQRKGRCEHAQARRTQRRMAARRALAPGSGKGSAPALRNRLLI